MNSFDKFSKQNETHIGEGKDFVSKPPVYYNSLYDGILNYFETIDILKDKYHLLLDLNWRTRDLNFNFNDVKNTVGCILNLHRFFELFFKDILSRVNPFLSVRINNSSKDYIQFLNNEVSADELKTVEYKEAKNRVKEILERNEKNENSDDSGGISHFRFLKDKTVLQALDQLAIWRNRIMHNGKTLPNLLLLDYLISQKIIPVIDKIIKADVDVFSNPSFHPTFYQTRSGISIIEEFKKINYEFKDFGDSSKKDHLYNCLLRIGHLKELGRSNNKLDFGLRLGKGRSFFEFQNDDFEKKFERFARSEMSSENYNSISVCPSCDYETLVIYVKETHNSLPNIPPIVKWCRCTCCDYYIRDFFGDPYILGYSMNEIFS